MKTKTVKIALPGIMMAFLCLLVCSRVMAQQVVGWRTDGTGRYPNATPPIEWSMERNVVWKTPMPDCSNSTPVVVGDRIFVCSEPTTLICVRASDGEILWQRTNTYLDAVSPKEADKVRQQLEQVDIERTTREFRLAQNQLNRAKNKLKRTPDDAELRREIEPLQKRVEQLKAKLEPVDKYVMPEAHDFNGYSSSTPVSDGENVYVLFGTGVAACYDMDGKRKWIKLIEKPTYRLGHGSSPVLVGETLIIHLKSLIALDKRDGEVLWKNKAKSRLGTAVRLRLGDSEVIITPNGDVLNVSDGGRLTRRMGFLECASPIIHDGVIYFIQSDSKGLKLSSETANGIKPKVVWQAQLRKDTYCASPVYHDGMIYAVSRKGGFSVINASTGEVVHQQRLRLGKGDICPSVTLAGSYKGRLKDEG